MVRINNYGGNVWWSHSLACVRSEERKQRERIEQYFGLWPQVPEAIVRNHVFAISDSP